MPQENGFGIVEGKNVDGCLAWGIYDDHSKIDNIIDYITIIHSYFIQ
jgi:hypothetical protein